MFAIAHPESGSKVRLEVFIEPKHVDRAYDKLYQDLAQRGDVRGFRPGKAPLALIRRHYGGERIDGVVYGELMEQALRCALVYGDLQPTRPADFGGEADEENPERAAKQGRPLRTDIAVVHVRPDVRIPDFTGLEFEVPDAEPTEEQIEDELKRLQDAAAKLIEVERKEVRKGDQVEVVMRTKVAGEEGGPEETDESLIVGEGWYDPPLDTHILGRNVGETVEFEIDYPDRPALGDLAGKNVEMTIDIKDLRERTVPAIDDDFAQQAIDGCTTVAELREEVTRRVREENEELVRTVLHGRVAKWLGDNVAIDLPESILEAAREEADDLDPDDEDRRDATRVVRISLACEALLEREGVEVTEDELRQEYMRIGAGRGIDPSLLTDERLVPEVATLLRDRLVRERAAGLIAATATTRVVPMSEFGKRDEAEAEPAPGEGPEEPMEEQENE